MEPKKIAFGFSKTTKKPILNSGAVKVQNETEKIELISCVEENAIRIVGKEHGDDEPVPLVIPLRDKDKKTIPDRLAKLLALKNKDQSGATTEKDETLEQKAAREILEDLKQAQERSSEQDNVVVPLKPEDLPLDGAQESTLDDYESVPIEQFGLAMLRGMGWKGESKDVKSDDKLPDGPVARPKGLGLGAERPPKNKNQQLIPPSKGEVLTMKPGALVKVLAGKFADSYGTVESLDEGTSRALLRFALGRNQEYVHEHLLQLVSKAEYDKYAKVLNSVKYEEYKNRPTKVKEEKESIPKIEISSSPEPATKDRHRRTDHQQSRRRSRSPSRESKRKRHRSPPRKQRDRSSSDDSDDRYRRDRHQPKSRKDDRRYPSDEDERRVSKKSRDDKERDQRRRSRTPDRRRDDRRRDSSDDSDDRRYSKSKKQVRERSRDRRYSSSEDDRHHRKKSKKSKKKKDHRRS